MLHFVGLTFALSWSLAAAGWVGGIRYGTLPGYALAAGFMLMPGLSALILQRFVFRAPLTEIGLRIRGARRRWLLAAIPMSWVVTLGTLAVVWAAGNLAQVQAFGQADFDRAGVARRLAALAGNAAGEDVAPPPLLLAPWILFMLLIVQGSAAGALVNLPFTMGEELGWRGMLLQQTRGLGRLRQTLTIGAIWGLWHAPLVVQGHNYPGHPWIGLVMMILFTTSVSYPMAWLAARARSVLAPAIFHGVLNAMASGVSLFIAQPHPLVGRVPGLAGVGAGLLLTCAVVGLDRSGGRPAEDRRP